MAIKTFKLKWMGVYRESSNGYYGGTNPIRVGGWDGYNSFLGFDTNGILQAMQSSVDAPSIYLKFYATDPGPMDFGMHKEAYNREVSSGIPYYNWTGRSLDASNGWNTYNITNFNRTLTDTNANSFQEALEEGFQGPVFYRSGDEYYTEGYGYTGNSYHCYVEIHGTWNTAPSSPSVKYPSGGEIFNKVHTVEANPATDSEQSSSELMYQFAVSSGTGWKYYDWGSPGDTTKTIDFSDFPESSSAKVAVRASDGELRSDYTHSNVFTIRHNSPPDIPTNLKPSGGFYLDRTQDQLFTWQHNDDEPQSRFQLQWREKGTSTWNEIHRSTNNEYYVLPANTLPVGEIEWRVETIDQGELDSPWSPIQIVYATEATDAPTILTPYSGETVTVSNPVIEWSSSDQKEYIAELITGGSIVWEESKATTAKAFTLPYALENVQSYDIRIAVRSSDGLWSDWDSNTFETSFIEPTQAELFFTEFDEEAKIEIGISNVFSGEPNEPAVLSNEVFRSEGGQENFIKISDFVLKDGIYTDNTPASNVVYEYKVRSWGDNGTFVDSDTVSGSVEFSDSVLSTTTDLNNKLWLRWNPERTMNKDLNRHLFKFNGRSNFVSEFDSITENNLDLSFAIRANEDINHILEILDSKNTLLYRDSKGRRMFVTLGSYSLKDKSNGGYDLSFSITEMDYREEVG
ncbi:hypothetical protein [Halobacillus sp. H74]|uniref:hypothetical protein n=1 Tax=Halobacillus sp. H74 TaxID=3457436 RepID=UPI003FCD048E